MVTGAASTRPAPGQHDEPTAEHHCETAGGIEPPCAVLQTATSPLGHAVMRGLRTIRTSVCFLGGSHAVPCTMSPGCFQQDSNLRSPVPETGVLSTGPWKLGAPGWIRTTVPVRPGLQPGAIVHSATDAQGCPTGFEPVQAWLTTKSLSHLGQGTSRPGRFRTCDLRRVKAALHQTELQAVRAPRRTRTSNDEFVIRHDLRFTMRAWYPHQEPNLGIRLVEPALFH